MVHLRHLPAHHWGPGFGPMTERAEVVVIGAGQAGLATSHGLRKAGIDHLVLDRGEDH